MSFKLSRNSNFYRVKAYNHNGWDKNTIDPDPNKKYAQVQLVSVAVPTDLQSFQLQSAQSSAGDKTKFMAKRSLHTTDSKRISSSTYR